MLKNIKINRNIKKTKVRFPDVFGGFEKVAAIKRIFGRNTKRVLSNLVVELPRSPRWNYMWINDKKGTLVISHKYLKKADEMYLYLDAVHELTHIKQYMDRRELFEEKYEYVDRQTEIEAYSAAAKEAKRLKMSRRWILKYLEMPGWLDQDSMLFKKLCKNIGM